MNSLPPSKPKQARVFISCGQRGSEFEVAQKLRDELRAMGFDPWAAHEHQSPQSIRENIFNRLRDFEYFIFIDFRRELVRKGDNEFIRGSVFCHQELAIASFLDMRMMAFRQKGVDDKDGLIGHIQGNCAEFDDPGSLVEQIVNRVKSEKWTPDWHNGLELSLTDTQLGKECAHWGHNKQLSRWAFLTVKNCHRYKPALDCFGYSVSARNPLTGEETRLLTGEQKWSGYTFPSARISRDSARRLDAFYILKSEPKQIYIPRFTDSTEYRRPLSGSDSWELTYEVVSSNIPGDRITIRADLFSDYEKTSISSAGSPNLHPSGGTIPYLGVNQDKEHGTGGTSGMVTSGTCFMTGTLDDSDLTV